MHLSEKRWFAVRTKSRHEKRAVTELKRAGIEAWIPLREKACRYKTRKDFVRELPLLCGYVFVHINKAEELTVLRAHYVSRFVSMGYGKIRRRVTDAEMQLLQLLSTDRETDWTTMEEVFEFKEGTPVEIIRGPLSGVRGRYVKKQDKKTFVIALGGLNACLSTCFVDPSFLVALNGADLEGENGEKSGDAHDDGKKSLW